MLRRLRTDGQGDPDQPDQNERRLIAAELLYKLVAQGGCIFEEGNSCLRVWMLEPSDPTMGARMPTHDTFALRVESLFEPGTCFARERIDVSLPRSTPIEALNQRFGGRALSLRQLASF